MLLVFSHDRFDFGQFPDLMAKWFGVGACQSLAASTTSVISGSISGDMTGRLEDSGDDMPYVVTDLPI